MNISGPAAVAKPEMLFYAPGDLTVTFKQINIVLLPKAASISYDIRAAFDFIFDFSFFSSNLQEL